MTRTTWMVIGAVIAVIVGYVIYDSNHTSRDEAGHDLSKAAQSTGEYVKDTANEIKEDIKH